MHVAFAPLNHAFRNPSSSAKILAAKIHSIFCPHTVPIIKDERFCPKIHKWNVSVFKTQCAIAVFFYRVYNPFLLTRLWHVLTCWFCFLHAFKNIIVVKKKERFIRRHPVLCVRRSQEKKKNLTLDRINFSRFFKRAYFWLFL